MVASPFQGLWLGSLSAMTLGRTHSTRKNTKMASNQAENPTESRESPASRPPATLLAAATLAVVEAVAALVAGGWLVLEALAERPRGLGIAVGSGVFVLAAGLVLGLLAWGLYQRRRWSRSPVVVLQLLMLPIGYELLERPTTWVGVGMLVSAVATLLLVLAPASTAVFRD